MRVDESDASDGNNGVGVQANILIYVWRLYTRSSRGLSVDVALSLLPGTVCYTSVQDKPFQAPASYHKSDHQSMRCEEYILEAAAAANAITVILSGLGDEGGRGRAVKILRVEKGGRGRAAGAGGEGERRGRAARASGDGRR